MKTIIFTLIAITGLVLSAQAQGVSKSEAEIKPANVEIQKSATITRNEDAAPPVEANPSPSKVNRSPENKGTATQYGTTAQPVKRNEVITQENKVTIERKEVQTTPAPAATKSKTTSNPK